MATFGLFEIMAIPQRRMPNNSRTEQNCQKIEEHVVEVPSPDIKQSWTRYWKTASR